MGGWDGGGGGDWKGGMEGLELGCQVKRRRSG